MSTCMWCGARIFLERSWPSGDMLWKETIPVLGGWAFCPAVDGNPHEPATAEWLALNRQLSDG